MRLNWEQSILFVENLSFFNFEFKLIEELNLAGVLFKWWENELFAGKSRSLRWEILIN